MSSGDSNTHVVVMTKFPEPGKVKTRMAVQLGADGACKLHAAMVSHLIEKTLTDLTELNVKFHVAGGNPAAISNWLGSWQWVKQVGENLGEKMSNAIQSSFDECADKAIILGTDAPGITPELVREVLIGLDNADVVFVPAFDGGYVMAGMKGVYPEMFEGIEWSTDEVLETSVNQLENSGIQVKILDAISDIDTPDDLNEAENFLGYRPWEQEEMVIPSLVGNI